MLLHIENYDIFVHYYRGDYSLLDVIKETLKGELTICSILIAAIGIISLVLLFFFWAMIVDLLGEKITEGLDYQYFLRVFIWVIFFVIPFFLLFTFIISCFCKRQDNRNV